MIKYDNRKIEQYHSIYTTLNDFVWVISRSNFISWIRETKSNWNEIDSDGVEYIFK
jgi:hypothetical protein